MINLILAGVLGAVIATAVYWLFYKLLLAKKIREQKVADRLSKAMALLHAHYCRRISRQLHDGLSQDMSLMKLNLHLFHRDQQYVHLQQLHELMEKGIVELRRISRKMQPEKIDRTGILQVLELELQFINKYCQVNCIIDDPEGLLQKPRQENLILFSLLEEILLNAAIHANATLIQIVAETLNNQHSFLVRDNGLGFNTRTATAGKGLSYLKEQANCLGAALKIKSTPNKGTCIELVL